MIEVDRLSQVTLVQNFVRSSSVPGCAVSIWAQSREAADRMGDLFGSLLATRSRPVRGQFCCRWHHRKRRGESGR
jgi:hypothetical protein